MTEIETKFMEWWIDQEGHEQFNPKIPSMAFSAGYKTSEQFYQTKIKKLEQDLEIAKALVLTNNIALDLTKEYIKSIAKKEEK